MAELVEQEKQAAGAFSDTAPMPKKKKKNRKKLVRRIVALVVAAALIAGGLFAWRKLRPGDDGAAEVLTETVYRGSITSVVRGSGAASGILQGS